MELLRCRQEEVDVDMCYMTFSVVTILSFILLLADKRIQIEDF